MSSAAGVLSFWFGDRPLGPADCAERMPRWFGGGEAFDAEVRAGFADTWQRAAAGGYDDWVAQGAEGRLALVIVLDQFSRNLGRGTPAAFAQDRRALGLTLGAIAAGTDLTLGPLQRMFLYMPLQHSEDRRVQALSVRTFSELAQTAAPEWRGVLDNVADYAVQHRDIVEHFGRFPHRNDYLSRASTQEEQHFLTQPGSSF